MKIMMGVDMEGITGVCSREQSMPDGRRYAEAVELAVGDVNAAVTGLVDAGADEIIVWDNHYLSFNHLLPRLHPGARYVRGGAANGLRWAGLDGSVDGLILLGYHAKAGTLHGVLDHTMSSENWHRLRVNGREIGEVGMDGALAGAVGVPVIMVTGCDKLCAEGTDLLGPDVVTVCVKHGHARHGATCLPPARTAAMITAAAGQAVGKIGQVQPLDLGSPAIIELTYQRTDQADAADLRPFEGRRVDGYTVRWTCPDFAAWMGPTAANGPPTGPK